MTRKEILEKASNLAPEEKFLVIEALLHSLDVPDKKLDKIWLTESEKRLKAYREGRLECVSMEEIFK